MVDLDRGPFLNNMDMVCRLCLSEDGNTVPIFDNNNKHAVPLPIQIMSCAQIQVSNITHFIFFVRHEYYIKVPGCLIVESFASRFCTLLYCLKIFYLHIDDNAFHALLILL